MELTKLIAHPELMNKETLYDLRNIVALHPYYQPARLLMLQNLYLLHEPTFDEELRRSAVYLTDRKKLFQLVEAAHYIIKKTKKESRKTVSGNLDSEGNRTITLINNFLDSIPKEEEESTERKNKRKPTPADAAVDYVSYLLDIESKEESQAEEKNLEMKGQELIDNFINKKGGKIQLKEEVDFVPEPANFLYDDQSENDEGFFTETLAKIYIKQGRYSKALEIIQRLNLNYPKKNAYFADQIRFLEKIILNNNTK